MNTSTKVFKVKISNKWSKVRATSIKSLSDWAKNNNVSDWHMVGMMSNDEIVKSQKIKVVA